MPGLSAEARPARRMLVRGYEAIPELLRQTGVGVVFSMLGGTNVPWIAKGVLDGSLRLIKTRHEQTAVGAAAAYARATGQVGVCSVTRGPGFANCINALVVAVKSHVPILLIVGESPTRWQTAQDVNQQGLTTAVGAGFHHVESREQLEGAYWRALEAARWNGCPQVLSIKSTLLADELPISRAAPRPRARPGAQPAMVRQAIDAIADANHPLILAGSGVLLADCQIQVSQLASLIGADLATSLRAHEMFASDPAYLGLCGGWSPPSVRARMAQADVVLAVGTSLNQFVTAHGLAFPRARVIHCEIDPDHVYSSMIPDMVLAGDALATVEALITEWRSRELPSRSRTAVVVDSDAIHAAVRSVDLGHDPSRGLDPREVYIRLDAKLHADRVIVTDTGRFLGTLPSLVHARDARSWLVGNSFQSVGQGIGAAIGAATAYPDRPVVLFTGDGGFTMASQDLDAVSMNGLSLTIVIINDEQYGSERHHLEEFGLPMDIVRQPIPDVSVLAKAYGGTGTVVRTPDDVDRLQLGGEGLRLIDIRVDPEVNVRSVPAAWAKMAAPTGFVPKPYQF